jgi:hypothetical protein
MYIYNDEDNVAMEDPWGKYTVYSWKAEADAYENGQSEHDEPYNGCWNCTEYNGYACMRNWNNADESYYCPATDDHDPDFICDDWEHEPGAIYDDFFGED